MAGEQQPEETCGAGEPSLHVATLPHLPSGGPAPPPGLSDLGPAPTGLLDLPAAAWAALAPHLPTTALAALRLTCRDAAQQLDASPALARLRLAPTAAWLSATQQRRNRHDADCKETYSEGATPPGAVGRRFSCLQSLHLRPASARDFVKGIDLEACLVALGPCTALRRLHLCGWPAPAPTTGRDRGRGRDRAHHTHDATVRAMPVPNEVPAPDVSAAEEGSASFATAVTPTPPSAPPTADPDPHRHGQGQGQGYSRSRDPSRGLLCDILPPFCPRLTELVLDGGAVAAVLLDGGDGAGGDGGAVAALAAGLPALRRLSLRFRAAGWQRTPRSCPDLAPLTQLTALQLTGVTPNAPTIAALGPLTGLAALHLDLVHEGYDRGLQALDLTAHIRLTSLVLRAWPPGPAALPCPAALRATLRLLPSSLAALAVDFCAWRARPDAAWPPPLTPAPDAAAEAEMVTGARAVGMEAAPTPQLRCLACPPELVPCLRELGLYPHAVRCLRLGRIPEVGAGAGAGAGGGAGASGAASWAEWASAAAAAAAEQGGGSCSRGSCAGGGGSRGGSGAWAAEWQTAAPVCGPHCCCGADFASGRAATATAAEAAAARADEEAEEAEQPPGAAAWRDCGKLAALVAAASAAPLGALSYDTDIDVRVALALLPEAAAPGVPGGGGGWRRLSHLQVNVRVSAAGEASLVRILDACVAPREEPPAPAPPSFSPAESDHTTARITTAASASAAAATTAAAAAAAASLDLRLRLDRDVGGPWLTAALAASANCRTGVRHLTLVDLTLSPRGFKDPVALLIASVLELTQLRTLVLQPVRGVLRELRGLAPHGSLRVLRLCDVEEEGDSAADRPLLRRLGALALALGGCYGHGEGQEQAALGPAPRRPDAGKSEGANGGREGAEVRGLSAEGRESSAGCGVRRWPAPPRRVLLVPQLLAWEVEALSLEVQAAAGGKARCELVGGG
ncbi:hypothetical protein HYH03_014393 [Edaphochlamys debaryana]|uniref:Uncharacterized protein n=1 Tax=Edaphochlamys debaryana TaxID=47281 RepID=A0A835XMY0_9CHLO|nr:hypothetical protein HYH03_014393 [Edaphochlamys debaryana]|eukprot:KAG2487023.1 hypothetical protein HYH03_014393 [Edaphochlamys debaryana]